MSASERRNPDELLSELKRHEARERRGKLKIFFGASAGVGKTYSMLESARSARAAGVGVGLLVRHPRFDGCRRSSGI